MATNATRRRGPTTRRYSKTYRTSTTGTTPQSWGGAYKWAGGSYSGPKTSGRKTTSRTTAYGIAPGYKQVSNTFAAKMRSFRTLYQHTKGSASQPRPSAATFKTFTNWVNKGANVWYVTSRQINDWCHTDYKYKTGSSAKTALCKQFGKSTIKAISCSKSGFLVATAPTWKGKTFEFPG